jgi:hypothetical protein
MTAQAMTQNQADTVERVNVCRASFIVSFMTYYFLIIPYESFYV